MSPALWIGLLFVMIGTAFGGERMGIWGGIGRPTDQSNIGNAGVPLTLGADARMPYLAVHNYLYCEGEAGGWYQLNSKDRTVTVAKEKVANDWEEIRIRRGTVGAFGVLRLLLAPSVGNHRSPLHVGAGVGVHQEWPIITYLNSMRPDKLDQQETIWRGHIFMQVDFLPDHENSMFAELEAQWPLQDRFSAADPSNLIWLKLGYRFLAQ